MAVVKAGVSFELNVHRFNSLDTSSLSSMHSYYVIIVSVVHCHGELAYSVILLLLLLSLCQRTVGQ